MSSTILTTESGHVDTNRTAAPPIDLNGRLLTAQEVAERLGVSERFVRDHATRRSPKIQAVRLGPLLRFRWKDVEAFLAELETVQTSHRRRFGV
jgi:excisionase family DNA binding protein